MKGVIATRVRALLFIGCCGLYSALAATPAFAQSASEIGDGGVTAFYSWTKSVPARPGELLRTEPLTPKQSLENAGENIRLLYASTDGLGTHSPVAVSGALFLPKGTAPEGGWPLLAWAHGTVGIADICAPSFAGRSGRDTRYLNYWLGQGYAIVATDYQGLGTPGLHPYVHAQSEAYSILDSIRAVRHYPVSKQTVLIGQSQGGGAVVATSMFAKDYAADVNIVGAVGTGVNVSSGKYRAPMNNYRRVAYYLLYINSIKLVDPSINPKDYLSDQAIATFDLTQTSCFHDIANKAKLDQLTKDTIFKRDAKELTRKLAHFKNPPTMKTSIPIFWGTGGKDIDVNPEAQRSGVLKACEEGTPVEWHIYPEFDHSATVNGSLPDSTAFIKRAFGGEKIQGNCLSLPNLP